MVSPLVLASNYKMGFTLSGYVKGGVDVYCGGVYLGNANYDKAWVYDFTCVDEADPLTFYSAEPTELIIDSVWLQEITNTQEGIVRLIPFQFSTIQAYELEFGDKYIRFYYKGAGQVIKTADDTDWWVTSHGYVIGNFVWARNGSFTGAYRCKVAHTSGTFATDLAAGKWIQSNIYEIVTPYLEAELRYLKKASEADTMYITCPNRKPMMLTRTRHTAWTLTDYAPNKDPFSPAWVTSHAYVVDDCVKESTSFYICLTAHTSGTFATDLAAGKWAVSLNNYPQGVTIFQGRLWFGGTPAKPQTIFGSVGSSYYDMDKGDGTAEDDAIEYSLGSNDVNIIKWLTSKNILMAGTSGGVFTVFGGGDNPITPTNIKVSYETTFGVADTEPQRIGNYVYYIQDDKYTVREFKYSFTDDNYSAVDMSILAQSLVQAGIKETAFQQSPYGILWSVLEDGTVAALTRQIEHEVAGWWEFITDGDAESVCALASDGGDSEVTFAIKRRINNQDVRYIERLAPFYFDDVEDAINTHSTVSLDNPKTIQLIEEDGDNLIITSTAHGFIATDIVIFNQIEGMTQLNRKKYVITAVTTNTFTIAKAVGITYSEYTEGGLARKCVSSIVDGLDHLEGMEVDIVTDGYVHDRKTVVDGELDLDWNAGLIHIGLPYESYLQTNRIEVSGSGQMTSQGLIKRVISAMTRFYKTGITGIRLGDLEIQDFVSPIPTTQPEGEAVELFTGDQDIQHPGVFEKEGYVVIKQTLPLPAFISCLVRKCEINEG
jgi:hypothetical protein